MSVSVSPAGAGDVCYQDLQQQVHVWFCQPDAIDDVVRLQEYADMLSAEERVRWQRFLFEPDRHRFLVAHALVRTVLSKYADVAPADWGFAVNTHGRPEIVQTDVSQPLYFNLSHTDGLCVCLVSAAPLCGVDVEHRQRRGDLAAIARRMFANDELEQMQDLPEPVMRQRFFEYWTLREAYVKALGTGLSGSSKQFHFELQRDGEQLAHAVRLVLRGDAEAASAWQFALLAPTLEHVAAVAVRNDDGVQRRLVSRPIVP